MTAAFPLWTKEANRQHQVNIEVIDVAHCRHQKTIITTKKNIRFFHCNNNNIFPNSNRDPQQRHQLARPRSVNYQKYPTCHETQQLEIACCRTLMSEEMADGIEADRATKQLIGVLEQVRRHWDITESNYSNAFKYSRMGAPLCWWSVRQRSHIHLFRFPTSAKTLAVTG